MDKKILLINISRIGDVVSSMIVANFMKATFGSIDFLVEEEIRPLLMSEKNIRAVSPSEALQNSYHIVVDLTSSKDSRYLVRRIRADEKIGFYRSLGHKTRMSLFYTLLFRRKISSHIVTRYVPILEYFGGKEPAIPKMTAGIAGEKVRKLVSQMRDGNKRIVGIHVGAGNPIRALPEEMVIEIIKFLRDKGIHVILLGNEKEIAQKISRALDHYPFYEDFNLHELKTLMGNLDLFLGPDSGLLHMAAALDVPSIGLYGPNIPSISAPLSRGVDILELDLACRPCSQKKCPYNRKCLVDIPLPLVLQNIKNHLF